MKLEAIIRSAHDSAENKGCGTSTSRCKPGSAPGEDCAFGRPEGENQMVLALATATRHPAVAPTIAQTNFPLREALTGAMVIFVGAKRGAEQSLPTLARRSAALEQASPPRLKRHEWLALASACRSPTPHQLPPFVCSGGRKVKRRLCSRCAISLVAGAVATPRFSGDAVARRRHVRWCGARTGA